MSSGEVLGVPRGGGCPWGAGLCDDSLACVWLSVVSGYALCVSSGGYGSSPRQPGGPSMTMTCAAPAAPPKAWSLSLPPNSCVRGLGETPASWG